MVGKEIAVLIICIFCINPYKSIVFLGRFIRYIFPFIACRIYVPDWIPVRVSRSFFITGPISV